MVSIQGGEDDSRIPLDNPPNVRHLHQLERDVEHFYTRDGLENFINLETLLKGAQIARNPEDLDTPNLSPAERNALEKEDSQWLSQTRDLSVTIMATACAAITQGWQQSTINASSLMGWDTELGLNDNNELLRGLINAAPWLSGSIIGTWLSDPLQERFFGRRPALFLAAIFCVACVIGSKASIAPVFAAEAAPDKHRGRVLMMWQLFDAFGIFMGFVCAFISHLDFSYDKSDNTKIKWFNFGFGIANFLFTLPSYYFIDKKGRRPLLLVSFIGMAVSLFAVSGFFYITKEEVRIGLVATFTIVIFNFFYSIGAGPIPFTLSAEVFPLCVREVGMSFSVMINFAFLGLLVLFVPALTRKFGHDKLSEYLGFDIHISSLGGNEFHL
ncbi:Major facilitator superfamily domain general substrate transporter [Penicillium macrosclerotiorum]|uniref:Major facilitator superfamily domain general substrate transporter n=1 Tax=Penicillium macrosclerotiorum TaxID=303699 RepID=UPI00254844D3|nr:Major facilitator superfamily domain general substrate transporter [Penicillium macrosclerotiorum]KAJ5689546.1 Major facilitator superfamily domain general substrate transporter [Penicillium macrosclerotiorum]